MMKKRRSLPYSVFALQEIEKERFAAFFIAGEGRLRSQAKIIFFPPVISLRSQ
jgi:hypothetical protein